MRVSRIYSRKDCNRHPNEKKNGNQKRTRRRRRSNLCRAGTAHNLSLEKFVYVRFTRTPHKKRIRWKTTDRNRFSGLNFQTDSAVRNELRKENWRLLESRVKLRIELLWFSFKPFNRIYDKLDYTKL